MSLFECKACKAKDEELTRVYLSLGEDKACKACESKDELIKHLRDELERTIKYHQQERRELKATVDRLLETKGVEPIGLGKEPRPPVSVSELLAAGASIFEEVEERPKI